MKCLRAGFFINGEKMDDALIKRVLPHSLEGGAVGHRLHADGQRGHYHGIGDRDGG